jgi:hypothetical protein
MSTRKLENLLWRYEYGRLPASALKLGMREELRRLYDAKAAEQVGETPARWNAEWLPSTRDIALEGATAALDTRQYHDALRHLRKAGEASRTIRELASATEHLDRATEAVTVLHELAGNACLRRLPALTSLAQLVDSMSLCMFNGSYGQARDLAALCLQIASTLREQRTATDTERSDAETRIAILRELCESTRAFADDDDPDAIADGSLRRLGELLADGHAVLASRLLGELEIALAARGRFRLHFRERLANPKADGLKLLVRERSWDGAVDQDCQLNIVIPRRGCDAE